MIFAESWEKVILILGKKLKIKQILFTGKKLNLKQQLFTCAIVLFVTIIVANITPWNQYKMYFMAPIIVFTAFIGGLISINFFKDK